nr:hypothetical protein [Tanacetum cinerariifolium]
MSAKRTSWNEFSSSMALAVICLSTGICKYENGRKRVFWSRNTIFKGLIVAQQVGEGAAEVNVKDVPATGVTDEGAASVNDDDVPAAVEKPFIPSHIPPTPPPSTSQDIPSTSQAQPTPPPSPIAQPQLPQQQPQPSQDAEISIDLL